MEHISTPKVENVKLLDRYATRKAANGTLYLTATHLIYVEASAEVRKETWILHHHIASVEKLPLTTAGYPLLIHCKNFHVAHFVIGQERDCHDVFTSLLKLSQPVKPEELYAFSYNPKMSKENREIGWKLIDLKLDYQRMGIPNDYWEITDINMDYELNAMANRAAGKGYENEDNYENIRFKFIGIENIHVMRSSLQKLLEVCEMKSPSMSDFLTGLENSGWLRHIKAVMDAGIFLAKAVREEKASVLVHCSDGWDRTAQVCSLAGLLLDPFYRTFKGFMVLIEKEWIAMGHKFSHRCGHLDGDPKEVSPVFTQFVECVWQLMQQFPCSFEFNERFLLEIHDHVFSCQFGNFLGTCHKEREDLKIFEKTHSLWPFLLQRKQELRNPLYRGFTAYRELQPNTLPFSFQFWCGMYNRFDKGMHPKQCVLDHLLSCMNEKVELEDNASELENKLPFLDGPLLGEGSSIPKSGHPSPKAPVPSTAQDYGRAAPPVLSNGASPGAVGSAVDQKHKENLSQHHQDPGASTEAPDSAGKDGKAQHQ
ncbi:phosphatidylinositol-3,5-bisphosphate 3-phosphatase MTMR8 isoform X2 [Pithys albifrons albifrons]|uniref:phosphatidylinositol-3,5-bisphosphate 3-phosphatase MTMR8 isoform X2 n=1 Tax=Pithys albifrons albifrons TaxID=3385563 RepID=UPI003A5CCB90